MAKKALHKVLVNKTKRITTQLAPWNLLPGVAAYNESEHSYPLRSGTMPTSVKLYSHLLQAAVRFSSEKHPGDPMPFRMIEKRGLSFTTTVLEAGLPDHTSLIIEAKKDTLRATIYEQDGTRSPTVALKDYSDDALSCIILALLPFMLEIDQAEGNSLVSKAIADLGLAVDNSPVYPWPSKNEIPDMAKDAAYFLDAALTLLNEKMDVDLGLDTSDTPAEIDDTFFQAISNYSGNLICENTLGGMWSPLLVQVTGKAAKFRSATVTVGSAKADFSSFSAHRNWTAAEKALIPVFDDDMPVMPEVLRMANRIVQTRNDVNPVCNLMWRGETGFGKSTGMKQLACILNVPFLTQTCHPGMEANDLKSMFVPSSDPDDGVGVYESSVITTTENAPQSPEATVEWALHYVSQMDPNDAEALLGKNSDFFLLAIMDQEQAETSLFGQVVNADLPELCRIYTEVSNAVQQQRFNKKIQEMEQRLIASGKATDSDGPQFVHVVSPYIKAMTNGYIVEIQEASRIRDSGVLVSINEFDRPGSMLPLMNGKTAVRHKDAICVITDNVGYSSCRPIDPSVLRRQSLIIDSYDMPKEMLLDRVKRNTGVTDKKLLDLAYKLWEKVKETCAQNSITEGSVSPVELERFVQAVKYDGPESIGYNLDDCLISKATSSLEDQKIIRTNCQTLVGTM